jgi:hypothetical protein
MILLHLKNNYNLNNDFSIEVWLNQIPWVIQVLFFKKKCANNTTGYDLSIVNGQSLMNVNGSGLWFSNIRAYTINTSRWYHLAVTLMVQPINHVDGLELGSVTKQHLL